MLLYHNTLNYCKVLPLCCSPLCSILTQIYLIQSPQILPVLFHVHKWQQWKQQPHLLFFPRLYLCSLWYLLFPWVFHGCFKCFPFVSSCVASSTDLCYFPIPIPLSLLFPVCSMFSCCSLYSRVLLMEFYSHFFCDLGSPTFLLYNSDSIRALRTSM